MIHSILVKVNNKKKKKYSIFIKFAQYSPQSRWYFCGVTYHGTGPFHLRSAVPKAMRAILIQALTGRLENNVGMAYFSPPFITPTRA
jgi:hypothetical protein